MFQTFKGRISLVYLGLVLLCALIGTTAAISLFRLGETIDGLVVDNYKSIKAIGKMRVSIEQQDNALLLYMNGKKQQGRVAFFLWQKRFSEAYEFASHNISEIGEQEYIHQINEGYVTYLKAFTELQEIISHQGKEQGFIVHRNTIQTLADQIKNMLDELENINEEALFTKKSHATRLASQWFVVIILFSLVAVGGGFVLSRYLVDRFFEPVNMLTDTIRMVKNGELGRTAPVVYRDEIGELATEFNYMTQRLAEYEKSKVGILLAEKNRTLAVVRSISDPLIVFDRHLRVQLMNEAARNIFGVVGEEKNGKHFFEVLKDGELFAQMISVTETGVEPSPKMVFFKDGTREYYFNSIIKTVKDDRGDIGGILILFQDITQLKMLERTKTDFIATVSHEFKTPLTSIMMGVSLLFEEKIGSLNEKQRKTLGTIQEEVATLSDLVGNLLEISRVESEKSLFMMQPCSVVGLVEPVVKKFLEQAEVKEVNLYFEVDDNLPKVTADPEKIQWVLNNLLSNALKYTDAGDEVIVTAGVDNDKMAISVKDTGTGIPPEYIEKIFDKFVQVKGYDLEIRGTGLGLAIVKEIVEAHNGEIRCESTMDVGSTFTFTIPLSGGEAGGESPNRG